MFANYHTHTARCHHATGEDKAYVEAAIQNGFQVLGFSDHCPWIFSDGYVSPIRMTPDELDGYVTSLTALKKEYAADITIYIGLESEWKPEIISILPIRIYFTSSATLPAMNRNFGDSVFI